MPLVEMVPRLLRGLRTIVLLWVGLLAFALLLELTGLRADPGPSEFKELRQHLEMRVNVAGTAPQADIGVRFDNFMVSVYLVPLFLFRWMCGFGMSRRMSPAAILTPLLLFVSIAVLGARGLVMIDRPHGMAEFMAGLAVPGWVFVAGAAVAVLIGVAIVFLRGVPPAVAGWFLAIPATLDRRLRRVFDLESGRIADRLGRRMSFVSNAALLAGLAAPSAIALWWACDWLDGRGGSVFAFVVRGAIITICMSMVVRAHMRSYATGTAAQSG